MNTIMEKTAEEEKKDIQSILQISMFEDINEEDIRKALWLLNLHPKMLDVIKNYELSMKIREDGLSEYEMATAYGRMGKRETGQELTADVTANSVVLKDKREALYNLYQKISYYIVAVLNNLRDPHEKLIGRMLFVDGMRAKRAIGHISRIKQTVDLWPIAETTFYEKRRKVIVNATNSLKIIGILNYVDIDRSAGRGEDGECQLLLPGWEKI